MADRLRIPPDDEHNRTLVGHVHPPGWKNPTPSGPYDLIAIGAGTGGLITALLASTLGARAALVERHLMGGDCLNVGCVPSKALIRAAEVAHEARSASGLGLALPDAAPDFAAAMERMRSIRARISKEDSAERYTREFGVDVYLGNARFTSERALDVDGVALEFRRAVIATGARASAPPIPGLEESGYLDNESVFNLTECPKRLAILGAGPIGCELAQAFRRLGAQVTVLERMQQVLPREDPDAARIVQAALEREGIEIVFGCELKSVERRGSEKQLRVIDPRRGDRQIAVDAILVSIGRAPNIEDLGLERAGVAHDKTGVKVDDFLRTSQPRIYAVGDVCMQWKFTHAADAAAKIAVQNALFALGPFGRRRVSQLVMPWCTYTDPEIAHVGLYEQEARAKGIEVDTYQVGIERANRAVTDGQEEGLVKIHVRKGTDRIVGATVVARHAGELITQLTLAISRGIGLSAFTQLVYPYPTQGEAIKAAAGLHARTRLTPTSRRVLGLLLRLHR
jgi:pyruvate/2-oxoglutarate dehydrogenase complex dihydrolipoamide dehydrogenase (E3) component